jgi:hypothetical protein
MTLREGLPIAAAAVAAPLAGTFWWMLVDQITLNQAIGSPFPYLMLVMSWFLATPIYVVAHSWIAGKLWRVLLLATVGATPFVIKAVTYFLTPRDIFVAFLILSVAWVAATTFWGVLRLVQPPEQA